MLFKFCKQAIICDALKKQTNKNREQVAQAYFEKCVTEGGIRDHLHVISH